MLGGVDGVALAFEELGDRLAYPLVVVDLPYELSPSVWSARKRRAASTPFVVSVTVTCTPPTTPCSMRIGLYENVKKHSSR